jgi:predicted CoA-binding protein
MNDPEVIRDMLTRTPRTLAVVGLSAAPGKPSHYVSAYMQVHGFRVLPVNPAVESVLGEPSFPSLTALVAAHDGESGGPFDGIVNVFRLPKAIPAIVDEMITLGLRHLWIQQDIVHPEAAARAEDAGIQVVMDRCIMVEHRRVTG